MNLIWPLFKKEFKSYFISPIAYIYMTTTLVFLGWYFFRHFFLLNQADMRFFFNIIPWIFLFLIPAISMRAWSEEKKSGTLDFLFTFPIKDIELILGKFLGSSSLVLLTILGTLPIALVVSIFGDPDSGAIIAGYLGVILLSLSYLAIGFFISSITQNQIIAFILSVIVCFFGIILSNPLILFAVPDFLIPIFQGLSLSAHYESISRGVIDLRDVLYYFSVIFFFLFLNLQSLDSRRFES